MNCWLGSAPGTLRQCLIATAGWRCVRHVFSKSLPPSLLFYAFCPAAASSGFSSLQGRTTGPCWGSLGKEGLAAHLCSLLSILPLFPLLFVFSASSHPSPTRPPWCWVATCLLGSCCRERSLKHTALGVIWGIKVLVTEKCWSFGLAHRAEEHRHCHRLLLWGVKSLSASGVKNLW